jgi:hypothetical protein
MNVVQFYNAKCLNKKKVAESCVLVPVPRLHRSAVPLLTNNTTAVLCGVCSNQTQQTKFKMQMQIQILRVQSNRCCLCEQRVILKVCFISKFLNLIPYSSANSLHVS